MSDPPAARSIPTTARSPFDDPSADVILRTKDHVDFHVHKLILSLASSWFKTMFSLPQGENCVQNEPPVIDIEEDSRALEFLLHLCYPIDIDPAPQTLEDTVTVLEAAVKYDLEKPAALMMKVLRSYIQTKPLSVYAIACRFRTVKMASEVIHTAACACKTLLVPAPESIFVRQRKIVDIIEYSYVEEMNHPHFTAGAYQQLRKFLDTGNASDLQYPKRSLATSIGSLLFCKSSSPCAHRSIRNPSYIRIMKRYPADLVIYSSDNVELRVHQIVIGWNPASDTLGRISAVSTEDESGLSKSVVHLQENSEVLIKLLELAYPTPDAGLLEDDRNILYQVWLAARKYGMKGYLISLHHGWVREAKEAARLLVTTPINELPYVKEIEFTPARGYYNLLQYHKKYWAAQTGSLQYERLGNLNRVEWLPMIAAPVLRNSRKMSQYDESIMRELVEESDVLQKEVERIGNEIELEIDVDLKV
ncbi:hypothetical protein C8Q75DRAFT_807415 [Abortiporus biennis]|nr:hypothetical protein C8Q75DRAFT_807415 [Abortiporus biennis]